MVDLSSSEESLYAILKSEYAIRFFFLYKVYGTIRVDILSSSMVYHVVLFYFTSHGKRHCTP